MGLVILFALIGVPLIEIAVFVEVGERLGLWPTLALVVATAMLGTAMLRHQGLSVLARARESLEAERFPVGEIFDGVTLLIAAALLLTPGFVTDAAGFLLLVPGFRRWLGRVLRQRMEARGGFAPSTSRRGAGTRRRQGRVIDGEYEELRPDGGADGPGKVLPPGRPPEHD